MRRRLQRIVLLVGLRHRRGARRERWSPPPAVVLGLRASLPGAVVRLLPAALMLGCTALTAAPPTAWVLTGVAAVAVTWQPRCPAVPGFTLLLGWLVLAGPDLLLSPPGDPGRPWRLAGLVLGLHLVHRTAALASHLAWTARIEVAVLARAARSVLAVQAVAQALALVAGQIRSAGWTASGRDWPRIAAVAAAAAVALLLAARSPTGATSSLDATSSTDASVPGAARRERG